VAADAHLTGPGVAELKLPAAGPPRESNAYLWLDDDRVCQSPRFRFRPINADGGRALATTPEGSVFCAAFDRGQGRIVYLSVPYGLSISKQAVPVVARLVAHLTRGLMPVEVQGDVEWMVSRAEGCWLVTLLNPAGQAKPQHGITPTDFRENRTAVVRSRLPFSRARDRLLPGNSFSLRDGTVQCEVPAGGVRILELR